MKSDLKFVNFAVPKFLFEKATIEKEDNTFNIEPNAVIIRSENQIHINIEVKILDPEHNFNLEMLSIGVFEYSTDDEEVLLNFISINGPAIVFPYVRSFISSYTALSGFDTITLPTLNLSGYKDQIKDTLIDLDSLQDEQ